MTEPRPAVANPNARLEAMSDGVFAIAMTLLILDVRLPGSATITGSADMWRALQVIVPSALAFILSFTVIYITWVNHHAVLDLVRGSTAAFLYANGFLLLAVVALPFPTGLLGAFLATHHAAPAVVLYNAVLAALAIGWILLTSAALRGNLAVGGPATASMQESNRNGYFAFGLYALLAIAALWLPLAMAIITTLSWLFWLALGLKMKRT